MYAFPAGTAYLASAVYPARPWLFRLSWLDKRGLLGRAERLSRRYAQAEPVPPIQPASQFHPSYPANSACPASPAYQARGYLASPTYPASLALWGLPTVTVTRVTRLCRVTLIDSGSDCRLPVHTGKLSVAGTRPATSAVTVDSADRSQSRASLTRRSQLVTGSDSDSVFGPSRCRARSLPR